MAVRSPRPFPNRTARKKRFFPRFGCSVLKEEHHPYAVHGQYQNLQIIMAWTK
jgi:hypothetical protein